MASFDQFSNLVLLEAFERRIITVPNTATTSTDMMMNKFKYYYSDIPLGVYVIRGDSMVLAGDVPENSTSFVLEYNMEEVSIDQLKELQKIAIPELIWDFDGDLTA